MDEVTNENVPATLAFLGCGTASRHFHFKIHTNTIIGNLGTAILCGVLQSIEDQDGKTPSPTSVPLLGTKGALETTKASIPTNFIACVRTPASATRISQAIDSFSTPVEIHTGHSAAASLSKADIIVLGCQPGDLKTCLDKAEIKSALEGKLLISLLAGVTLPDIESTIRVPNGNDRPRRKPTNVIRAMPNTASFVRSSMTIIEAPGTLPPETLRVVDWLFGSIGTIQYIPGSIMDSCTALCASSPAFFAVFLDALIDGAVATGLSRADAQNMAAQAMKGCADLVLAGESPTVVKEKITTPGGSTIRGVLKLEQGNLRSTVAEAFIECKKVAESLGRK